MAVNIELSLHYMTLFNIHNFVFHLFAFWCSFILVVRWVTYTNTKCTKVIINESGYKQRNKKGNMFSYRLN